MNPINMIKFIKRTGNFKIVYLEIIMVGVTSET